MSGTLNVIISAHKVRGSFTPHYVNGNRNSPVPEAVDMRFSKIAADESVGEDDFVTTNEC